MFKFTKSPRITYIYCCVLVLYLPQSVRVSGQPYSLTSFGLSVGSFERLGNVYGCEGLALVNYRFHVTIKKFFCHTF
jgi:hypothetical protein